jgi:hypothetical protein
LKYVERKEISIKEHQNEQETLLTNFSGEKLTDIYDSYKGILKQEYNLKLFYFMLALNRY